MKTPLTPLTPRRSFLKQCGTAAAALALPWPVLPQSSSSAAKKTPDWVQKPMRWAQLTLVEDDPGKYDLKLWLDYFKRTRSDAACLSAGGCVAFYPTQIPFHYKSKWMGPGDPFGDLAKGCRKQGMAVIARTDPHATYDDAAEKHPEWIAVEADGKKRRHWASPEMWVTCGLGPYNFEFMTAVHREIMSLYRVDGIFINRWDGSGMCYCDHCQANFRQATGLDLPRTLDPQNKARREYILWRQKRLFDLWQLWDGEIRQINPESCVIPNTGGGALSMLDMDQIGRHAEMLVADRQARRGLTAPWANSKNAKEYRSTMGDKPCIGLFSVGLEEPYRWKDSVQHESEIRIWAAEGIANGLRPWFSKFSGVLHDPRWLKPVEEIFQRHARVEPYLRDAKPVARVALVYSQQSAWFYGGERAREKLEDHTLGFYQALIESRIPFEMVHDRRLDADSLREFRTLILPNIAALSENQCQQIRQFVQNGGGVVATYETSLYDELGQKRRDFGLADLFGANFAGRTEGPMRNSYLKLHGPHPLLRGLEDTPRIVNGVWRLEVNSRAPGKPAPLTLIPSYPDLPMEKVYPREDRPDKPQVFLHQAGRGRVVYFPWDIDRVFWEVLSPDHGLLLRNAIDWASQEERLIAVEGPGLMDVTLWRQPNRLIVHFVNLTNPMTMKGPYRELLPSHPQKVKLRLGQGEAAQRARFLLGEKALKIKRDGNKVAFDLPPFLDHEIAVIDL